jgi:hypothetical protein
MIGSAEVTPVTAPSGVNGAFQQENPLLARSEVAPAASTLMGPAQVEAPFTGGGEPKVSDPRGSNFTNWRIYR